MNEEQIKWNYKVSMNNIYGDQNKKRAVIALLDNASSSAAGISVKNVFRTAAAFFCCILALVGLSAWAMTGNTAFRRFFFEDSDEEFDTVYDGYQKELIVGGYKIVFDGLVYEDSVKQGILSFSVWDAEGQPVEVNGNVMQLPLDMELNEYTCYTCIQHYKAGEDEWYILLNNINGISVMPSENNIFIAFSMLGLDTPAYTERGFTDFQLLMLDGEDYRKLKSDIDELDTDDLLEVRWDPVSESNTVIDHYDRVGEALSSILNRYDPLTFDITEFPVQIVQVENLKLTIGRMNIMMEYDPKECTVNSFTMIRENGESINFTREFISEAGIHWKVEGLTDNQYAAGVGTDEQFRVCCNFGFIMGSEEKVTIVANGNTYR